MGGQATSDFSSTFYPDMLGMAVMVQGLISTLRISNQY